MSNSDVIEGQVSTLGGKKSHLRRLPFTPRKLHSGDFEEGILTHTLTDRPDCHSAIQRVGKETSIQT